MEVMRARGAGGQVRPYSLSFSLVCAYSTVARKQNGICCAPYTHTDWDYRFDARRTESTSGASRVSD
jgi:hypothetical protein